jgi:hypothetical protein
VWTGGRSKGYGLFWWQGRTVPAHRLLFESAVHLVPEKDELDHLCRNRACVRPDHLRIVSHQENVVAGIGKPAVNAAKLCCPKGHPYTVVHRSNRSTGSQRRCLVCKEDRRERAALAAFRAKWHRIWTDAGV